MPLYIPWLTETIKKRGIRYILHHYLGQFFEEKLTLEQLSIDIYEGKGSIRNLALDVDGLNDNLDFIPFRFLDGCLIGQISVEVPWASLATDACKVELDGAKFVCRLKTSADGTKTHCTESTLLTRSLMTSSMQMAEEIVTTEDDDDYESPESSMFKQNPQHAPSDAGSHLTGAKKKNANQMFEGLEMFAQLIDSVLRRTKLTARNTLFQIQPYRIEDEEGRSDDDDESSIGQHESAGSTRNQTSSRSSGDEFSEPLARSDTDDDYDSNSQMQSDRRSRDTVEFFIRFFRCEEMVDQSQVDPDSDSRRSDENEENQLKKSLGTLPELVTKLLTLEDVEMRINGKPVSNLIGKHTITIKFSGQKSEISIFSGSPLLAVISHEQLETFFNVFDSAKERDIGSSLVSEKDQKMMSPEDYAKIENQLLESVSLRTFSHLNELGGFNIGASIASNQYYVSTQGTSGRRWVDSGETYSNMSRAATTKEAEEFEYHSPNSPTIATGSEIKKGDETERTLDNIEAFSCELKLPGVWLCILQDGEILPPLIKPYADSINSFQTINKYIDDHIKIPHIRCLALKVALDITAAGTNIFLGDLDLSEHSQDESMLSPTLRLLHNDTVDGPGSSSRYRANITPNKEITIDLLTKTRVLFDPTMIDRIVYDYKLIKLDRGEKQMNKTIQQRNANIDLNLTIKGEEFKVELLCPIPDLTPEADLRRTELRPQSFIFDFKGINLTWQSDKLNLSSKELLGYVKTQPKQSDNEATKFVEATAMNNDRILLVLEPSPSNLDTAFPNEIEQALNESSLYDSIYVGHATESRIPTEAFQTKRKVVRAPTQDQRTSGNKTDGAKTSDCDHEKILTPGDRQHVLDYLNQTVMFTKLSMSLHLPSCEVEFEDKEQLDLIYNRFGNDFVFWHPKALTNVSRIDNFGSKKRCNGKDGIGDKFFKFKQPKRYDQDDSETDSSVDENGSEGSYHSVIYSGGSNSDCYDNEVTCKITVGELLVRFNHQSCAAALKQEISTDNLLLGVVIDVKKKPNTLLSLVVDNLELSTDSTTVLEGNTLNDKSSTFSLTAEIKRPTKALKDIKLAIQLNNGLFNDFKMETYTRFLQSINVTDEPILGYVAPRIVTELHIDVLNTALSMVKSGARPALLSIDELYLTSMLMEQTSQLMIRLIADEVSFYLKRNRKGLEIMKNYICLIDSGLIDLNVKFSQDGRLEFGVINNVITVRVCQDSLSALCKLFNALIRNSAKVANQQSSSQSMEQEDIKSDEMGDGQGVEGGGTGDGVHSSTSRGDNQLEAPNGQCSSPSETGGDESDQVRDRSDLSRERNLLVDAMNDFTTDSTKDDSGATDRYSTAHQSDNNYNGDDDVEDNDYSDNDAPPELQQTMPSSSAADHEAGKVHRNSTACLLDESNPMLGDLFSQPLVPLTEEQAQRSAPAQGDLSASSLSAPNGGRAMDESGFFVIGDDDVGAGIIDKQQHEPVVRKLIDGPIDIVENHFKMTKPRTIPEMLASSLERYVLEEMTLVVNLYGGCDFDDEYPEDDMNSTVTSDADQDAELLDSASLESPSIRSRAGSVAGGAIKSSSGNRRQCLSDSNSGSLQRKTSRRKHLSEGSGKEPSGRPTNAHPTCEQRVRFGEGAVNLWESLDLMSSPDFLGARSRPRQAPLDSDSKQAGGTWRQTDVCIQLTLSKVKLLYELADCNEDSPPISWRFMLFVQEIEVTDRIAASDINKMLYEYCTESMPKRSTQILTIKNVATINPSDGCEECDLRVSLKPLRLNIDQDTLLFLIEFFSTFSKSLTKQQSLYANSGATAMGTNLKANSPIGGGGLRRGSSSLGKREGGAPKTNESDGGQADGRQKDLSIASRRPPTHSKAIAEEKSVVGGQRSRRDERNGSGGPSTSSSSTTSSLSAPEVGTVTTSNSSTTTTRQAGGGDEGALPTHCHTDNISGPANQQPIYIKSFTFSPDVPIRVDYHAKHLDFEQGALAGILMGLAHLDHSELVLRRVQAKHGMRGLDRVCLFTLNSWLSDIKRNQLPSILSGVGPMHSVIQLFQGMRDLVWMPIDHYRKDRRLVRGLQRGASSFSSSTAMAAINLVNRFISIVQCTAQIAHDIVTPPSMQRGGGGAMRIKPAAMGGVQSMSGNLRGRHFHHHHQQQHLQQTGRAGSHPAGASNSGGLGAGSSINGLNQPRNFYEGVAVGYTILKEGFNETARNVTVGMQADDMRSAVGEIVRQIPSTLLNPIISATEGAQSVLVGIRNQIAPDARREDQEKWKRRVRGK